MKTEDLNKFSLRITLNAEEAYYLKSMMQNYCGDQGMESQSDNTIRSNFWNGLPDIEKLSQIVSDERNI